MVEALTIAIGDIHGYADKLVSLLKWCEKLKAGSPAKYVFLGDYVDRGPSSRQVIDLLITKQEADKENVICLMGNHEDLLLRAADPQRYDRDLVNWFINGGEQTLESYGVDDPTEIPAAHLRWMKELQTKLVESGRSFVHAGLRPGVPMRDQDPHDLLWIREPFLSFDGDHGTFVVHGHTPVQAPDLRSNRINLDTGAGFGRRLTAAFFSADRLPTLLVNDVGEVSPLAPAAS
jgi:diadenosine tetraphosphatase ApaH/serine/threonine PP2A family protein phosphatase